MMKSTFHPEKRHSKPCRFFQKGVCPLSADRCDFAHVKIQILPVKYPSDHLKPLQDGQCDSRESRQLVASAKHNEIGMPKAATLHVVSGTESHPSEEVAALTSPQTMGNSQAAATKVTHGSGHEPVLLPPVSGQPSGPNATCTTSVVSDDLGRLIFRYGDSSPTSDVPSLSDGDSDPPSAPCEVPEFPERWPSSASVPSPLVYCNPTPGFYSPNGFSPPGVPFVHPAYVPWTLPKPPARSESRRHGMTARKLKALKTKQCKFFKKEGGCPQGSLCTFIHDLSALQSPQTEQEESPSDDSAASPVSPCESSRSKFDEEHERNIYPIPWRVIGGGVMMGGRREVCKRYKDGVCPDSDDCPYTHPWEVTDDIKTPIDGASSLTSTPRASYFPRAQTHRAADMSTVKQPVPSVPELIPDLSPIGAPRRGRGSPSTTEDMPPRPFSTPPRISSRTETH